MFMLRGGPSAAGMVVVRKHGAGTPRMERRARVRRNLSLQRLYQQAQAHADSLKRELEKPQGPRAVDPYLAGDPAGDRYEDGGWS
jgi:hypothetical protein